MSVDSEYLIEIASPAHAYAGADAARIREIAGKLDRLEAIRAAAKELRESLAYEVVLQRGYYACSTNAVANFDAKIADIARDGI